MWAVLSDIHGNLEALDAVLADIAEQPVTQIFCLGDVVGYGPNPLECLERALDWDVTILGNHDQALLSSPESFSHNAARAIYWQRSVFEASGRNDLWAFLGARPRTFRIDEFEFVHGSPRNPLNEYIFPEDSFNELKMNRIGEAFGQYCFTGHTHVPGVFTAPEEGERLWQFKSPPECKGTHRLTAIKSIVNVGSVGQPRDEDWRASYVLVDGLNVTWRRVEYDVDTTVRKIHAIPQLENFLGDRLRAGR
jgi:diadenosine tetraphosphatase ApaH/serine/threonine PP2A family protein phosphatase